MKKRKLLESDFLFFLPLIYWGLWIGESGFLVDFLMGQM